MAGMSASMRLSSADNPRVKAVVRLGEQRERRKTGLFVAEGRRQIQRALAAKLTLVEWFACDELTQTQDEPVLATLRGAAQPGFVVTPGIMGKMAYRQNPEALLAVFEQRLWTLEALDTATNQASGGAVAEGGGRLWLVAVGTTKPGNLGAMLRSAEAAGAAGLLVADGVVDPFNPNVIHASTGAVFELPMVAESSEAIMAWLVARGAKIAAAVVGAQTPHTQADLTGEVALVIGAEDTGLDEHWRQAAQNHGTPVAIPMRGRVVDSLNASTAAAVLLFEAVRQRTGG